MIADFQPRIEPLATHNAKQNKGLQPLVTAASGEIKTEELP
ncbi:MAG: hypothetical protein ACRCYY_07585 [Trueperaceae bacterium]